VSIEKIAVVGLGTMGSGIAQVAIQSGLDVVGVERDAKSARASVDRVSSGLDRQVKREKITADEAAAALARLTVGSDLAAVSDADAVVEAVYEDVALKTELFGDLDKIASANALLASNTSTIPLIIMASSTSTPERVVGLHFFNPVPLMKLVEVVRTPEANPELVTLAADLARALGKSPVIVNDVPGFVGNLLVVPFLLDAIRAYERGVADMGEIDDVLKLGFNHPMGPFALSDLIGLDIVHDMAASMYEEYRDPKYWPPTLLKQYVRMGRLGRKTGHGFYAYDR
jgi:3-hydroxybutyryl-CoA dehydrogenase